MAAPYRTLKITYGSYVAGAGQAKRHVTGPIGQDEDHDRFEFRFQLQVAAATGASDFETEIAAARAAFTNPGQDLKVELVNPTSVGTVQGTILSALPSTGTALNVVASIGQPQIQEGNTERSAVFDVVISGERPADYDAAHLRYDFAYDVSYSSSRRKTLRVTGAYTKVASGSASRAQYLSAIATKVGLIQAAIGGDWSTVPGGGETTTTDGRDHVTRFSRTYRQLLRGESTGALDDADITNQDMTIAVASFGATGGDRGARPLTRIVATYRGDIDTEQVDADDFDAKWVSKIEPWIRQNIRQATGASSLAIMVSEPQYHADEGYVTARVEALAAVSKLIERQVVTKDSIRWNHVFRAYPPEDFDTSDDPSPHQVYPGSKVVMRTIETRTLEASTVAPPNLGAGGGAGGPGFIQVGVGAQPLNLWGAAGNFGLFGIGEKVKLTFESPTRRQSSRGSGAGTAVPGANILGGGVLIARDRSVRNGHMGLGTDQIPVSEVTLVESYRIVAPPPASASGSGGGGGSDGTGSMTRAQGRRR